MKIKPEWLVRFRQEAGVTLQEARLLLAAGIPEEPADAHKYIRQLFIKAHNIKGTASMVGLPEISAVAFELETLWGEAMQDTSTYSPGVHSLAQHQLTKLTEMVEAVRSPDEETLSQ